jgi:uncharacterized protein (DUF58 family)
MQKIPESELFEFSKKIELTATKLLEGMHFSSRPGEGVEYHSSRPYAEGDDPRQIDWKRFASTDRIFTRLSRKEKKTSWSIAIDSSQSMHYGEKLSHAQLWAGCLLFLAKTWGDSWSLGPGIERDLEDAFLWLLRLRGEPEDSLPPLEEKPESRLVFLTDGFWDEKILVPYFQRISTQYSKVYLVQILESQEVEFNFSQFTEFRDFESRSRMSLQPEAIRNEYLKRFTEWTHFLQSLVESPEFFFQMVVNQDPIEKQLERKIENL